MSSARRVLVAFLVGAVAALIYGLVGHYSSGRVSPAGAPVVGALIAVGFYVLVLRRRGP